ncbi:MAG: RluA family pseudouridine synthase [Prevotellaceae bacterium]|nr:RluA family pseudouridine synthase [Prevotellaceae bacterium]
MKTRKSQTSQDYRNRRLANRYTDYHVKQPCQLLEFLMTAVPGTSRTKAKQLLARKMVYINNTITTHALTMLQPGQVVQIAERGNLHDLRNPYVHIVYEDNFLLVVEKAAGILTNTLTDRRENSLKRILDEYVKRTNPYISTHTVHRLDRYTSGLLIFAKRRDVQQIFTDNWHDIVTDRRYIGVVQGEMEHDTGTVDSWLKDNKTFMTYSSPYDNGGKRAITHYRTLQRENDCSLVEFKLETGRKNQIRVHMQVIGHPIVGDLKYGSDIDPINRLCLHAYKLQFIHPITHELLQFESPIPPAFLSICKTN